MNEPVIILKALLKYGELHVATTDGSAPGSKPHSYELWGFPRWMLADIEKVIAEAEAEDSGELTIADYEEVLEDKRRLTRELDVALNGEAGAAKQASLCDLIGDAKEIRARVDVLEKLLGMAGP